MKTPLKALAATLATLLASAIPVRADVFTTGDRVMLQFGPYVWHRVYDKDHNNYPLLIGAEWESESHWEIGANYFKNSYYQPCAYVYGGKRWFFSSDNDGAYLKLTAGPLYGYRGQYEDKVPLNHRGLGFAIIPGLGYQYERANAQLVVLGTAGVMVTFGYDFWK